METGERENKTVPCPSLSYFVRNGVNVVPSVSGYIA